MAMFKSTHDKAVVGLSAYHRIRIRRHMLQQSITTLPLFTPDLNLSMAVEGELNLGTVVEGLFAALQPMSGRRIEKLCEEPSFIRVRG